MSYSQYIKIHCTIKSEFLVHKKYISIKLLRIKSEFKLINSSFLDSISDNIKSNLSFLLFYTASLKLVTRKGTIVSIFNGYLHYYRDRLIKFLVIKKSSRVKISPLMNIFLSNFCRLLDFRKHLLIYYFKVSFLSLILMINMYSF